VSGSAASGPLSTALQCFVAVARHHGVDLSVERLVHDYAIADGEDSATRLLTIARESGFKARAVSLGWHDLSQVGEAYPFLARLDNGNTVIVVGFRREAKGGEAAILDPLADRPGFVLLDDGMTAGLSFGTLSFLFAKRRTCSSTIYRTLVRRGARHTNGPLAFSFGSTARVDFHGPDVCRNLGVSARTSEAVAELACSAMVRGRRKESSIGPQTIHF